MMLKRIVPVVVVVAVLAAVTVFLLGRRTRTEVHAEHNAALVAVPDDAVWILESGSVPDLVRTFVQSDPLFPALRQITGIGQQLAAFRQMDSLIRSVPRYRDFFNRRPAVVSFHQTGKSLYQFLMILGVRGNSGPEVAGDFLSDLSGSTGQWTHRVYNGQQINRITFGPDAILPGVSMAEMKNLLVISPSPILLENSIRQISLGAGLPKDPGFARLTSTTGRSALAHLYVNLKLVPGWLGSYANNRLKRKMDGFTRYGDWASLDLSVRNDAVWMNGYALEGDTLNSWLHVFHNQDPGKLEADRYLPYTTAAYLSLATDKPAGYLKGLSDYLGSGSDGRKRQRLIDQADKILGEDVLQFWSNLGMRELTLGFLYHVSDETTRPFVLVQVKSAGQARERLVEKAGSGKAPATARPLLVGRCRIDGGEAAGLYAMPYEGAPEILGGSFFSSVAGKYFALMDPVVVIADDTTTIGEVLHKYALNKSLANDGVYRSLSGMIQSRSNFTFFDIPERSGPILKSILSPEAAKELSGNDRLLGQTAAIGFQFNSGSPLSLHNVFASFAHIDLSQPQTLWESRLDDHVAGTPAIVTNHLTNDREILLQDQSGHLYLINSSGRILWKKNLGEPVTSEFYQIDLLRNGRLQYLFSTVNAIHLIDRNGDYVKKFPVALPKPATNGMTLVDFDHNRDYRIFIACTDNSVYCFDKNGNRVKGWKFAVENGPVTKPVQHFRVRNRDWLVCTGPVKVYLLDRKGVEKIRPEMDFAVSQNSLVSCEDPSDGGGPVFTVTDIDGVVHTIHPDGKVGTLKVGDFSPEHSFCAEDLNGDGKSEWIFLDRNRLEVYNPAGERLWSRKFEGNASVPVEICPSTGNGKLIGVTIPSKNRIYLIDGTGSDHDGFPLSGKTRFVVGSIDKSSGYRNLLVGGDEPVLFNYALR
jgi:outer membrane protein assembly factor BamB